MNVFQMAGWIFLLVGFPFLIIGMIFHRTMDTLFLSGMFIFMGALFTALGGWFLIRVTKKKEDENQAVREGEMVEARVTSVRLDTSVSYNGNHPWVIDCEWVDPDTLERHRFESREFMEKPQGIEAGMPVSVHVVRDDPAKYHVDL